MPIIRNSINRRKFVQQAGCAALGSTTLLSTLLNLKTIGASAADSSANCGDYKALVCVLLSGGNDSFNMLIPTDNAEYNHYAASRSNLAIPQNEILPINALNTGARTFGLHPSMNRTQSLFDSGKLAFVSNIGTLIEPITKQQFYNGTIATPLGLYSHSDQIMHWQTGIPNQRIATGWAGKIADLLHAGNTNQTLSMNMSMHGSNVWQTSSNTVEFSLNPSSGSNPVISIWNDNDDWIPHTARKNFFDNALDANYYNALTNTYTNTTKQARVGAQQLEAALANTPTYNVPFVDTSPDWPFLSNSFKVVADMISARNTVGMNRQTFFIDFGGWDHHDDLMGDQPSMLRRLDESLDQFNQALEQLGMADCVTTFVMSEFGRTLTSNGDGSDHGWGGNVMVMGGSVNGQNIYGDYPLLELNSSLEVGGGVFIPTTSCDSYFAELALWFGVPVSELPTLFPNLGNFYSSGSGNPIGFLNF